VTSATEDAALAEVFERIYATDLVFVKDCWKLCGDAHCCSFSRYKARFRLLASRPFQELHLLPGEYAFLEAKGWLAQFGDFDRKVTRYAIDHRGLTVDSVVSRRPNCACDHGTRTTICRLYPLLPVYDVAGRVEGTDAAFGVYEEIERLAGMEPACKVTSTSFAEMQKFLEIANGIGSHPLLLFHAMAYRETKNHVAAQLAKAGASGGDWFRRFEGALLRRTLIDHDALRGRLAALADAFEAHYGGRFRLESA
jgi:hypothetical protein